MKIKTLVGCLLLSLSAVQCWASPEAEVRALVARWGQAFKIKNVEQVMACYAPGSAVRAFDIVPPLECSGHDAYRKNYEQFFAMYRGPIELELRDLQVIASADLAFITVLERMAGTLTDGQKSEMWVRVTSGLRKMEGRWLIVHDHVSVPVDFASGKALLELKP